MTFDPAVAERIGSASALLSWAIEPQSPDTDHLGDQLIAELTTDSGSANVAGFMAVCTALLHRLAAATGQTAEELWRDVSVDIALRYLTQGDDHNG